MQHLLEHEYGIRISAGRVYRLMKQDGHSHKAEEQEEDVWRGGCKNHLNQEFRQNKPNAVWCDDFTYIRTDDGWAIPMRGNRPFFSRKVISWTLSVRHSVDLMTNAFLKAFENRFRPVGFIFHCDRGSGYTYKEFRNRIGQCSVLQLFSAKEYPYDNSICESFFKHLKIEEIDRKHYRTKEELRLDLFSYIDCYYDSKRIHSYIGYKTPNEVEKKFLIKIS